MDTNTSVFNFLGSILYFPLMTGIQVLYFCIWSALRDSQTSYSLRKGCSQKICFCIFSSYRTRKYKSRFFARNLSFGNNLFVRPLRADQIQKYSTCIPVMRGKYKISPPKSTNRYTVVVLLCRLSCKKL